MQMSLTGVDRFEIVQGEIVAFSPTGGRHGQVEGNAYFLLANHIRKQQLGRLYVGEVGVVVFCEPLTVRGADVAFVHVDQGPPATSPEGYLLTAPALVVEVLSPNDRASEVERKVQEYLLAGVAVVLVLDPDNRCATLARPDSRVLLSEHQRLELPDLLPGWSVGVEEFFQE